MLAGEKFWQYPPIRVSAFTFIWVSTAFWWLSTQPSLPAAVFAAFWGLTAGVINGIYVETIVTAERAKTRAAEWKGLMAEVHAGIEKERQQDPRRKLLFRLVPHNQGAVFATEQRAMFIARLHTALAKARTWGEFAQLMPPSEHRRIVKDCFEDEPVPAASDEFSADLVPGFSDGDYPPWLQAEMDKIVPRDILAHFGVLQSTFASGSYWHIPEGSMEPMANMLRERGFTVTRAQEMRFH